MTTVPEIIIQNPPLDFELSELLGETPADFLVLYLDGKKVPFFGTPPDSPHARETQQLFVDGLNDRTKNSMWPEFFTNWKAYFCRDYKLPLDTTPQKYHPTFSWNIHRVCSGYSQYPGVAIGVFEKIGSRLRSWQISQADDGTETVELESVDGKIYRESGSGMARLLSAAMVRLLRDSANTKTCPA